MKSCRYRRASSVNNAATVLPDLLSQGSHVAPSPQRRITCRRHETELTYCPVYGFKPTAFSTRGLTPALFCPGNGRIRREPAWRAAARPAGQPVSCTGVPGPSPAVQGAGYRNDKHCPRAGSPARSPQGQPVRCTRAPARVARHIGGVSREVHGVACRQPACTILHCRVCRLGSDRRAVDRRAAAGIPARLKSGASMQIAAGLHPGQPAAMCRDR